MMRRRVPWREMPLLVAATALALVVEVGLRMLTLPRLAGALGVPLARSDQDWTPVVAASQSAGLPAWGKSRVRATQRILRHWRFGDTCLRQALISGCLLRELRPVLHIGVAKIDGEFRAHAWLVVNGVVIDTRLAASSYQTLHSEFPRSRS